MRRILSNIIFFFKWHIFRRIISIPDRIKSADPKIWFFAISFAILILISFILRYIFPSDDYLVNIIVEFHGLIFDIIVFGILITIYDQLNEKRTNIKRWKEELEDYKYWQQTEASFRIKGIVNRLNLHGAADFNLDNCYFNDIIIDHIRMDSSSNRKITCINSQIDGCFNDVVFYGSTFSNSKIRLAESKFSYSIAHFDFCEFIETHLVINGYISFEKCKFKDSSLIHSGHRHDISYEFNTFFIGCQFDNFKVQEVDYDDLEKCLFYDCKGLDFLNEEGNFLGKRFPKNLDNFYRSGKYDIMSKLNL